MAGLIFRIRFCKSFAFVHETVALLSFSRIVSPVFRASSFWHLMPDRCEQQQRCPWWRQTGPGYRHSRRSPFVRPLPLVVVVPVAPVDLLPLLLAQLGPAVS